MFYRQDIDMQGAFL